MSMTVYTAHVYVMAEGKRAYFELSYDNEMNPELAIKDSADTFIDAFNNKSDREKLVSEAFDANYLWEDDEPYYLKDEVEFSDFDGFPSKDFRKFCKEIKLMDKIQYVLFAVDSNKRDWLGYATYWYDAIVFDFAKRHLITIEWRGTELQEDDDYLEEKPFYKSTAEYLMRKLESGAASQIDVGDFMLNGKLAGKITEDEIPGENVQGEKSSKTEMNHSSSVESEEEKQIERISYN